jgi:TonB family protein
MMTRHGKRTGPSAADKNRNNPTPAPAEIRTGADLASSALAIARIEGQISRQLEEYNQRPRKKFIGARVEEYRFAQYVEDWRQKIERIGNLNYPDAAKGRLYGSLVLTVIIKSNGDLDRVEINRSSGQRLLDDAARRIVQMSAPFAAFPEAIRRDTDVLEITRTWTFTNADRLKVLVPIEGYSGHDRPLRRFWQSRRAQQVAAHPHAVRRADRPGPQLPGDTRRQGRLRRSGRILHRRERRPGPRRQRHRALQGRGLSPRHGTHPEPTPPGR